MKSLTPRPGASRTRRMTRSGERWADATVISDEIPSSRRISAAACMIGASESEPIRIKTSIWDISRLRAQDSGLKALSHECFLTDIAAIVHAIKGNFRYAGIRARNCISIRRTATDDGEHASTRSHHVVTAHCRAGVEEQHIALLRCSLQTADR